MDHNDAPGSAVDAPAQDDQDGRPEEQGQQQQQQEEERLSGQDTTTTTATMTGTMMDANKEDEEEEEDHQEYRTSTRDQQQDHDDFNASLLPPPLPDREDSSLLLYSSEDGDHERGVNQTLIEEKEMRHKLMDMESSFLPEPSTVDVEHVGVDDTFLVGVPQEQQQQQLQQQQRQYRAPLDSTTQSEDYTQLSLTLQDETDHDLTSTTDNNENAPQTPRAGPGEQNMAVGSTTPATQADQQHEGDSTMFQNVASSPAAEAAARTVNQNPFDNDMGDNANDASQEGDTVDESTAPQSQPNEQLSQSAIQTGTGSQMGEKSKLFSGSDSEVLPRRKGIRPKYLNSRQSAQRLSHSSVATSNTDITNSDATLGVDYALQTGGAAPENGNQNQNNTGRSASMARSVSLGSVASGISGYSDENTYEKRNVSGATDGGLHTLEEEDDLFLPSNPGSPPPAGQTTAADSAGPTTPRPKQPDNNLPTDTAIAERVKDVQVPSTFARQFREDLPHRGMSPEKQLGSTPAFGKSGRNMTLKEQSSTIDRLSKENFDLKVRIHFLNESLNKRSEEGIKEMISENVELKSDKLKLQKDNQGLKRKLRDLEKELKDQSDRESMLNHDPDASDEEYHRDSAQTEEMEFLRERVETYEQEVERLRSEGFAKETEKRRLAEMVKSLNDGRQVGSEVGSREERVCAYSPIVHFVWHMH